MSGEDVIIGKTTPISQDDSQGQASRYTRRDHSTSLRHSESGMVDQVDSNFLTIVLIVIANPEMNCICGTTIVFYCVVSHILNLLLEFLFIYLFCF